MKQIKTKKKDSSDEEDASINTTFTSRTFFNDSLSMQPSENSSSPVSSLLKGFFSAAKFISGTENFSPEHSNIIQQPGEIVDQRQSNKPDTKLITELEKVFTEQSNTR